MAAVTKRMTPDEVGAVLTYINTKLRFKVGTDKTPVDAMTVASWKEDFDSANCGHYHIMIKAVGAFFRSNQAQYGVTPNALIACYKQFTRQIAAKVDGWEQMTYEERQAILAEPKHVEFVNGELTSAEYAAVASQNFHQVTDNWRVQALERGLPDPLKVGIAIKREATE